MSAAMAGMAATRYGLSSSSTLLRGSALPSAAASAAASRHSFAVSTVRCAQHRAPKRTPVRSHRPSSLWMMRTARLKSLAKRPAGPPPPLTPRPSVAAAPATTRQSVASPLRFAARQNRSVKTAAVRNNRTSSFLMMRAARMKSMARRLSAPPPSTTPAPSAAAAVATGRQISGASPARSVLRQNRVPKRGAVRTNRPSSYLLMRTARLRNLARRAPGPPPTPPEESRYEPAFGDDLRKGASDMADVAQRTGRDVRKDLDGAARQVGQASRSVTGDIGRTFEQQAEQLESSYQSAQRETQKQAEQAAKRADTAYSRIEEQGQVSANRLQSAAEKINAALIEAATESAQAAGTFGEIVGEALSEAILGTLASVSGQPPPKLAQRPAAPMADRRSEEPGSGEKEGPKPMADPGRYRDFKVFVAGASGGVGRLVTEKLAEKGVPVVRAFVRSARREKYLGQISGVQVSEGDVYKYETIASALGDSNIIICAVGIQPSPFDPLGPFKEFEGVLNLLAAAKNQGKVKKIVLVTSIGVSLLLYPLNIFWGLLFWKKQQEMILQRSGLEYIIVRPGGLRDSDPGDAKTVMRYPDSTFGGFITRSQVAEVCVESLVIPEATNKIVEVIAEENAPRKSIVELFKSL